MLVTLTRRSGAWLLAGSMIAASAPVAADAQFGWLRRDGNVEYQTLTGPGGQYVLEYPKRDWRVIPGGGAVMMTLAQSKSEAAVVIEYTRLDPPLAAEEITELFLEIEVDELKKRQPGASAFQARLAMGPQGRQSFVDFTRPGVNGDERVRQVSMPRGDALYRIVCSASVELFDKYEPVFDRIVETFRARLND